MEVKEAEIGQNLSDQNCRPSSSEQKMARSQSRSSISLGATVQIFLLEKVGRYSKTGHTILIILGQQVAYILGIRSCEFKKNPRSRFRFITFFVKNEEKIVY